ncbi:MAG: ATP-dependent DNA helicase, partial [Planctomycetes bacterium]|nr:ATP-dependent DNA helicase [Planctomycetota bacterium]
QIIEQQYKHYVYYASVPQGRGSASLSANPLKVGDLLKENLFDPMHSVILTSATLAADDSERFLFFRKRMGIEEALCKLLDSPFDFKKQARLLVNTSALDPNSPDFERAMAQWLGDYIQDNPGGTFVLFTSYRQLERVHQMVAPRLERNNRFVLRHGAGMGRSQMLELFKSVGDAVLFGTSSFWEGVDVRGDALKNVIITKIPFEVPNHPLVEARHQSITANGGNAFMERSVPEAILRLKQGVGRLIRTKKDSGNIVLCDHRIHTKRYGRYFLRALSQFEPEYFKLDDYLL